MRHSPNCGYEYTDICVCNASRPHSTAQAEIARLQAEVERLRELLSDRFEQLDSAAARAARDEALEVAARLIDDGADREIHNRLEQCPHLKYAWEDCDSCSAAAIRALKRPT